jgi:hypothetical protein
MSSAPAPETAPAHPILGFTAALAGALDRVLALDPVFMSPHDQAKALTELHRQRTRLEALELKVLAAADRNGVGVDTGPQVGATSTAAWLAQMTLADRPTVAAKVKLARALDSDHLQVAAGLAAGDYSVEHAIVAVHALVDLATDLPIDLDPGLDPGLDPDLGLVARAEKTLVEEAAHLTPRQLRTVGRHLLEVVAPDVAEQRDRDRLDRADAAAFATARLAMRSLGDGTTQGWFRLPDLHAAILKGAVEALIAPRKHDFAPDPLTGRTPDHATRMGQGFCEVLEHLPVDGYGDHGGLAATLLVTLDHETLRTGLGSAALVDGTEISTGEVRRLACGAGIIPAVLGGPSAVLDLGREARLFNKAQRIALALRDKGCRAEGCDRPPSWCEAHHVTKPWAEGGKTDLEDGILLCGHHHRLAHHPDYTHQRLPNGDLRYHRRT